MKNNNLQTAKVFNCIYLIFDKNNDNKILIDKHHKMN